MRSRAALIATTGVVAALLAGCGGDDESEANVDEVVHYSGDDRQSYLSDCAKDEGKLEIYTSQNPVLAEALKDGFAEKYPDIKVNSTRRTSAQTAEAVTKEAQARANKVDIVHLKVEVAESLLDVFTDFDSPKLEAFPEDAIGPDGKYISSGQVPYGLIYNTELVSEAEAPKTSDDLLDPKWKGRIALSNSALGTQWVGWMEAKYGEEWVERFGTQDVHTTDSNTNAITGQVAAGEAWMAPGINLSGVAELEDAPLEWVPIDPYLAEDSVSVAKAAPHPCAAMLYIDYVLSPEGQTANPNYLSARTDFEPPAGPLQGLDADLPGIWDIVGEHDAEAFADASEHWTELIDRHIIS